MNGQDRFEARERAKNLRQAAALIANAFDFIPNGYVSAEQRLSLRRVISDLREHAHDNDQIAEAREIEANEAASMKGENGADQS